MFEFFRKSKPTPVKQSEVDKAHEETSRIFVDVREKNDQINQILERLHKKKQAHGNG